MAQTDYFTSQKKVAFSMVIGHGEFMHDCSPKHSCMGTARMKHHKVTDEEGKKGGVSMERSKVGTKKRSHNSYHIVIKIQ